MTSRLLILLMVLSMFKFGCFGQTENYWEKTTDFGSTFIGEGLKRERAVAFSINGFGYIGTGIDTAEVVHRDFWKFNPTNSVWTQIADLPGAVRRNAIAFSIGNSGYVGTGINTVNSSDAGATILNDFWEYNSIFNTWVQKANFPGGNGSGTYFSTGFSIDSKGYICGGKMGPNNYSNQLWEYKPSINQWAQLANFPGGNRYQLSSFTIGFKAYVGLGTDQDLYRNDIWEFNASTNQWSAKASLPSSARAGSATFSIGSRGYVCMGVNGGLLDDLWEYNPFNDEWLVKSDYGGSQRKYAVGFSIDDIGYVGTGKGYSGKKSSFYKYYPSTVLGLQELSANIKVYPNPVVGNLRIETSSDIIEQIEIHSFTGELIFTSKFEHKIDVSTLTSGSYLLIAMTKNNQIVSSEKFIKH